MNWLQLIPILMSAASVIKDIVAVAESNQGIVDKVREILPNLAEPLESIGGMLFPNVKPEQHIAAVAMTQYDLSLNKWIQGGLNIFLDPSPNLKVDGAYGPKTTAAVARLQEAYGLKADGWAGNLTQTLLMNLFAKDIGADVPEV